MRADASDRTPSWRFEPVDVRAWDGAKARVLVLGAEPNGAQARPSRRDMGAWFAEAPDHGAFGNRRFFDATLAQVAGALGSAGTRREIPRVLGQLRYADVKSTEGGGHSDARGIVQAAGAERARLLRLWQPRTGDPSPPTVTVVQGLAAQAAFARVLLPALRQLSSPTLADAAQPAAPSPEYHGPASVSLPRSVR
jgi:hypothetical protein